MTSLQVSKFVIIGLLAALVTLPLGAVAAEEVETQVTVELQEFEDSGISGTAVLTATLGGLTEILGGDTQVSMELRGQELDGNHPTHIHTGTCDNFDPNPLYPLETVELSPVSREGVSESTVDATLKSLREGDFVIVVHQSPEELTNYLVCGEISGGTAGEVSGGTVGESDEGEQVSCAELEIVESQARSGDDHAGTPDHSGNHHGEEATATETDGELLCLPRSGSGAAMTAEGRSDILLLISFGALSLLSVLGASVIRQQRA